MIKKTFRDLKTQKWQFLAVSFLVMLGVSMFLGLYSSYLNIESTYKKFYAQTGFEDIGFEFNPAPVDLVRKVRSLPNVEAVVGRLTAYGTMDLEGREVTLKLVSIPEKNSKVDSVYVVRGIYPKGSEVLLLEKFAELNGISVGETLHVRVNGKMYSLRISGTAYNPEYVLIAEKTNVLVSPKDFGVLFVPYPLMEKITGLKGRITELHVRLFDPSRADKTLNRIREMLDPYGLKNYYKRIDQPSYKLLRMDLQGFKHTALMFPVLLLLIAVFAVYILLSRIVMEQMGIIAVLRALGYSKRSVVFHYLSHAIVIGVVGTLVGIFLGFRMSEGLTASYIDVLNLPYYVCGVYSNVLMVSVIAGMLTPILAGILTSRRVAEIEPALAMRGMVEKVTKVRLELGFLPVLLRMATKNVFRNPKRTLSTVFGVAMGVVLITTSLGFVNSVNEMMHVQFDKVQRFDYLVETTNLSGIRSLKDVKEAYPIVQTWIVFERNGIRKSSILVGLPVQNLYNVYDLNGKRHFPPPKGLIVPTSIARNLSVAVGERVRCLTELGWKRFSVAEVFPQPLIQVCYASIGYLEDMGFKPNYVIVKGGNENELKRFGRVVSMREERKAVEDTMKLMNDFFVFSFLMGTSLAFAEIFNTVTINVLERRREIATLRMLGYTVNEIALSLLLETSLMGILGLMLGFPLALATFKMFQMTYKSELFNMPFVIYPQTYLFSTVAIGLTLLLSILPALKFISRMDMAKITKEVG